MEGRFNGGGLIFGGAYFRNFTVHLHNKVFFFLPALFILGHYQALGRVIHMKYLHDQLIAHEDFSFADSRRSMDDLVQQLDILSDTLYIKVKRYSAFRLEPFINRSFWETAHLPLPWMISYNS